ncbi:hypothetical protein OF83DRAFT_1180099 [Amylostereum chailletii]|nr:hypothetical protein OF83DRAFT_1180099 [Amylostereum chailletii]
MPGEVSHWVRWRPELPPGQTPFGGPPPPYDGFPTPERPPPARRSESFTAPAPSAVASNIPAPAPPQPHIDDRCSQPGCSRKRSQQCKEWHLCQPCCVEHQKILGNACVSRPHRKAHETLAIEGTVPAVSFPESTSFSQTQDAEAGSMYGLVIPSHSISPPIETSAGRQTSHSPSPEPVQSLQTLGTMESQSQVPESPAVPLASQMHFHRNQPATHPPAPPATQAEPIPLASQTHEPPTRPPELPATRAGPVSLASQTHVRRNQPATRPLAPPATQANPAVDTDIYRPQNPLREAHYEAQHAAQRKHNTHVNTVARRQVREMKIKCSVHILFWPSDNSNALEFNVFAPTWPMFFLADANQAYLAAMRLGSDSLVQVYNLARNTWMFESITAPHQVTEGSFLLLHACGVERGQHMELEVTCSKRRFGGDSGFNMPVAPARGQKRSAATTDEINISPVNTPRRAKRTCLLSPSKFDRDDASWFASGTTTPSHRSRSEQLQAHGSSVASGRSTFIQQRSPLVDDLTGPPSPPSPSPRPLPPVTTVVKSPPETQSRTIKSEEPSTSLLSSGLKTSARLVWSSIPVLPQHPKPRAHALHIVNEAGSARGPWPLKYVCDMAKGFADFDGVTMLKTSLEQKFEITFPSCGKYRKATWNKHYNHGWAIASDALKNEYIDAG